MGAAWRTDGGKRAKGFWVSGVVEKLYVLMAILEYKDGRKCEEELHRYGAVCEAGAEMENLLAAFSASNAKLSRIEFNVREEGVNGAGENRNVLSQVCWFA